MQGQVIVPGKVVGQVGAVQFGTLVQFAGKLPVRQCRVAQRLPAVLMAGAMLVTTAAFLAIGQGKQALWPELVVKARRGQGILLARG